MSYRLTEKLERLRPYDPIEGSYRVRLDANESCFNLNDTDISYKIAEAVKNVTLNRYPDPYASETVKAFSELYNVPEEFVTAGNGSDELISIIAGCFLKKGDTVLTFAPDFSMYAFYSALYELNIVTLPKDSDMKISVDKAIEYCNQNPVNAIFFSNPCNPTSVGLSRSEVIRLVENTSALVILDEAYMDFWDESLLSSVGKYDNLLILKTCSKAIGLAAVRLGFAVAGKTITNGLRAAKSPYNTDSISQAIGAVVLKEKALLSSNCEELISSRRELESRLKELASSYKILERVFDSDTNFVFIKTDKAPEIHEALLNESIAVRNFGSYLRITAGTREENQALIQSLKKIISEI